MKKDTTDSLKAGKRRKPEASLYENQMENTVENIKALREISVDGLIKIGEGAHGEVYRIDEDTIAKVYRPGI